MKAIQKVILLILFFFGTFCNSNAQSKELESFCAIFFENFKTGDFQELEKTIIDTTFQRKLHQKKDVLEKISRTREKIYDKFLDKYESLSKNPTFKSSKLIETKVFSDTLIKEYRSNSHNRHIILSLFFKYKNKSVNHISFICVVHENEYKVVKFGDYSHKKALNNHLESKKYNYEYDGKKLRTSSTKKTSNGLIHIKVHYPDGTLKESFSIDKKAYEEGRKEVYEGGQVIYYQNGNKRLECEYENDKRVNFLTRYNVFGDIIEHKKYFDNGVETFEDMKYFISKSEVYQGSGRDSFNAFDKRKEIRTYFRKLDGWYAIRHDNGEEIKVWDFKRQYFVNGYRKPDRSDKSHIDFYFDGQLFKNKNDLLKLHRNSPSTPDSLLSQVRNAIYNNVLNDISLKDTVNLITKLEELDSLSSIDKSKYSQNSKNNIFSTISFIARKNNTPNLQKYLDGKIIFSNEDKAHLSNMLNEIVPESILLINNNLRLWYFQQRTEIRNDILMVPFVFGYYSHTQDFLTKKLNIKLKIQETYLSTSFLENKSNSKESVLFDDYLNNNYNSDLSNKIFSSLSFHLNEDEKLKFNFKYPFTLKYSLSYLEILNQLSKIRPKSAFYSYNPYDKWYTKYRLPIKSTQGVYFHKFNSTEKISANQLKIYNRLIQKIDYSQNNISHLYYFINRFHEINSQETNKALIQKYISENASLTTTKNNFQKTENLIKICLSSSNKGLAIPFIESYEKFHSSLAPRDTQDMEIRRSRRIIQASLMNNAEDLCKKYYIDYYKNKTRELESGTLDAPQMDQPDYMDLQDDDR